MWGPWEWFQRYLSFFCSSNGISWAPNCAVNFRGNLIQSIFFEERFSLISRWLNFCIAEEQPHSHRRNLEHLWTEFSTEEAFNKIYTLRVQNYWWDHSPTMFSTLDIYDHTGRPLGSYWVGSLTFSQGSREQYTRRVSSLVRLLRRF